MIDKNFYSFILSIIVTIHPPPKNIKTIPNKKEPKDNSNIPDNIDEIPSNINSIPGTANASINILFIIIFIIISNLFIMNNIT